MISYFHKTPQVMANKPLNIFFFRFLLISNIANYVVQQWLFIYVLFILQHSNPGNTASNGGTISEWWIWKIWEESSHGIIWSIIQSCACKN